MMTNLTILGSAILVAASIYFSVIQLKPLTPTDECWNIAQTWARRQAAGDHNFKDEDPQEIYLACLAKRVK